MPISTATQKDSLWAVALSNTPNARVLRMLVSKNAKICVTPNVNSRICITPKANPQHEQVEYRSRWVPNVKFLRWPCRFHVVCAHFILVGLPTQTQFAVEYGRNLPIFSPPAVRLAALLWPAAERHVLHGGRLRAVHRSLSNSFAQIFVR